MLKFFAQCKTKQELKREFRTLAKKYHPDTNKDTDTNDIMASIINEYEKIIKTLPTEKADNSYTDMDEEQFNIHVSKEMQEIIDNISHLPITIEIIGTWLWVSGNTRPYKSYLTAYNFRWSPTKKMYSWHIGEFKKRKGKTKDIEDIKATYGSQKVNNSFRPVLV